MNRGSDARSRRREVGLAIGVGLVCSAVSLAIWATLVLERHAQALRETRSVSHAVRGAVEERLVREDLELGALVRAWTVSQAVDAVETESLLASQPGLTEIAVFDLSGKRLFHRARPGVRPLAPDDWARILETAGSSDLETDLEEQRPPRSATFQAQDSVIHLTAHLVPDESGLPLARLVARHDAGTLMEDALRARALPYALEVRRGDLPIYARGEPASDPTQSWWQIEEPLVLPSGERWSITYRPTSAYAAARLNAIPHYVLLLGLGLSASLAFLLYELRWALRQSRSLADANRSLKERGGELLRLNEELERRVAERTQELEDAVSELSAFNYSVSHDLRSPLGAILNFASILAEDYRDRPIDEAGQELLDRIRRSGQRATLLLEDLLELSRAGRTELEMEDVDMTALARSAYQQAAANEDATDVEIRIDPLPPAHCDPQLMESVFVNLFSNALKYSKGREKRRIEVRGEREGSETIYTVSDNGRGFDMRFAPKLFQVFERLHGDDEVEGSGVGLAIVARILKRHDGRVWGTGEIDRGALFSFALPLRAEDEP